jgi:DNA-binding transcriptional MocR family regulator
MFIWVTLPSGLESKILLKMAIAKNVLFVPGENFYVGGAEGGNCLRMNFSNPSKEDISTGIKILGDLIFQMMGRQPVEDQSKAEA